MKKAVKMMAAAKKQAEKVHITAAKELEKARVAEQKQVSPMFLSYISRTCINVPSL